MRYHFLVAALSLGRAALAVMPHQVTINTAGEHSDRPLDITSWNADNASPYPISPPSNSEKWDFDRDPHENTTGNLIFDTVYSLLQHWPNTRYRNGALIFRPVLVVQ